MKRWVSGLIIPVCLVALQDAHYKEDKLGAVTLDMEEMIAMRDITPTERETSPYAETAIRLKGGQTEYLVYEKKPDITKALYEQCQINVYSVKESK